MRNNMPNKLKKILIDNTFPYIEIGISYYAKMLGSLYKALLLNGFKESSAQEIILTLIKFRK